jgi:surface antigen
LCDRLIAAITAAHLGWVAAALRDTNGGKQFSMAIGFFAFSKAARSGIALLAISLLSACATTSGSDRLDETGEQMAETATSEPEPSAYYIQALNGGLVSRINGVKLSGSDKARALEAEYKVLEGAPSGQMVAWEGSGDLKGEVMAAVPYQVGSQNCRQYTHSVVIRDGAAPLLARGAACRNKNGSWTPL